MRFFTLQIIAFAAFFVTSLKQPTASSVKYGAALRQFHHDDRLQMQVFKKSA